MKVGTLELFFFADEMNRCLVQATGAYLGHVWKVTRPTREDILKTPIMASKHLGEMKKAFRFLCDASLGSLLWPSPEHGVQLETILHGPALLIYGAVVT